ncbi:MAG: hypothetical protein Q7S19_02760 [bacterium]|nr:hypothetical protein [bacterium]
MEVLSKLFGSPDRIKIMRLFILNSSTTFTTNEVLERSKISSRSGKKELNSLRESGLIKQKNMRIEGSRGRKTSVTAWFLNQAFPFLNPLKQLLFNTELFRKEEIIRRLRGSGRIKVIITAGIFISDEDSRADLLVVGDELRKKVVEKVVKSMEAEIGRELSYGVFETEDFRYRISVCDKFIRDILDYPHRKILNKLEDAF